MMAGMLIFLLHAALAETLGPGEPVEYAAALHLPPGGLAHIGDAVEGLVPAGFPVSDISGAFECEEGGDPLNYALSSMDLQLAAQDVQLNTDDGALELKLYLTLGSTAADLTVSGSCSFLADLDETCGVQLPTTSVVATLRLELNLVDTDDGVFVDAVAGDPEIEISPIGNPLSDCLLADAIGTLLHQNESAISDLLLSFVEPELAGLGAELETSIEDALGALIISTDLEIGEGALALRLEPSAIRMDTTGLLIGFEASSAPSVLSACVPASEGATVSGSPWPELGDTAWGSSLEYDAALLVNKDFVDALLWGVWQAGALCIDVSELGIPLDTGLFSNLFGPSFAELFDVNDPQPLGLVTAPVSAPVVRWEDDGAPVRVVVNDLGLDFSAVLDERTTRLFRVGVQAQIGLDPNLDRSQLAPELVIDPALIDFTEPYNELVDQGFSAGLADFIPTVLASVLPDDLLPVISVPSVLGIGVKTVFWLPDEQGQWLGGFILLDTSEVQPIEVAGCAGGSFGCDGFEGEGDPFDFETALGCSEDGGLAGCTDLDAGCADSGCAVHRRPAWPLGRVGLLVFALSLAVLRRRS